MLIRQAESRDCESLARLIFSSAPNLLNAIFTLDNDSSAINFLRSSLSRSSGQYGFANHWVIDINAQPVACISAWHANMSESFQQATMQSVIDFYRVSDAFRVISMSQVLQDCIPKPTPKEWCVGHLAVSPSHQKTGLASCLLVNMQEQALAHGQSYISLDVDSSNTQAISFYLKSGFEEQQASAVTPRMQALGLTAQIHMLKPLI